LPLQAQQWTFDDDASKAYDLILDLRFEDALPLIAETKNAQEHYLASLAQALELLITEDAAKFQEYEDIFQDRLDSRIKASPQDYQFLMAELHLQWAFVYLKFGHEFDAGSHLREAHQIAEKCKEKYPGYLAIRKTTGLLEVILGSVPEKYNWLLSLLGMRGSITSGLSDLESVRASGSSFAIEADLLYALIHGFVFQKPETGFAVLKQTLAGKPANRLILFVAASLAIKNSQSEEALDLLNKLAATNGGLPLYYADYLKGEVHLHKAEYLNALSAYRSFINHYSGQNYMKDAHFKMGLCYWLNGNQNDAISLFKEARSKGKEASEADKSAARSLADKQLPHAKLSKARYAMDGGYYAEARTLLAAINDKDLPEKRDQVEYFYRKARLEHKTGQAQAAKLFYKQTIDMAGDENWYFAPNSCLQLGYMLTEENKFSEAKNYFQKALTYKKHEYKNSIDSKAKSAISRLDSR
jgi:tetratricopeptide (TPR) repeat protein